ncbi:outer membrane protein transport protein [Deltaproteobacteria bacterium TL4]
MQRSNCLGLVLLLALIPFSLYGAGPYTPVYSANQFGQANAIMTMPSHAEINSVNPAGMMRLQPGTHISAGGALAIFQVEWEGQEVTYDSNGNEVVGPVENEKTYIEPLPLPMFHYAYVKEDMAYGFSFKPRFAAALKFDREWAGNGLIQDVLLAALGGNFSAAYELNENHSVAVGITLYADVMNYRRNGVTMEQTNPIYMQELVSFGKQIIGPLATNISDEDALSVLQSQGVMNILSKAPVIKLNDKIVVQAHGFSYNFNGSYLGSTDLGSLGSLFFAANYNTAIPVNMDGEIQFFVTPEGESLLWALRSVGKIASISALENLYLRDSVAKVSLTFPWHLETGFGWKDDPDHPKYEVEFRLTQMGYSVFSGITVDLDTPSGALILAGYDSGDQIPIETGFVDTLTWGFGGAFHMNERIILRGGFSKEGDPNTPEYVSPLVPLGGMWTVGGAIEYAFSDIESVSLGAALWKFSDLDGQQNTKQYGIYETPLTGIYRGFAAFGMFTYHRMY